MEYLVIGGDSSQILLLAEFPKICYQTFYSVVCIAVFLQLLGGWHTTYGLFVRHVSAFLDDTKTINKFPERRMLDKFMRYLSVSCLGMIVCSVTIIEDSFRKRSRPVLGKWAVSFVPACSADRYNSLQTISGLGFHLEKEPLPRFQNNHTRFQASQTQVQELISFLLKNLRSLDVFSYNLWRQETFACC